MIKYNLICKCGKNFESWFSSSAEYDSLYKRKFIKCIYCNSTSVNKSKMKPNLLSKSIKVSKKNNTNREDWLQRCNNWKIKYPIIGDI